MKPEPAPEPEAGAAPPDAPAPAEAYWLLSLYNPAPSDAVDWSRGNYSVLTRGGRIESPAGWGESKKQVNMIAEGSVLVAGSPIRGGAPDVAPEGFPHPVYRAGFALSIPIPGQVTP